MPGRLSQDAIEAILRDVAKIRVSQDAVEVLVGYDRPPKLSQEVVEVLIGTVSEVSAYVSQVAIETIQQITVEYLYTVLNSQDVIEILKQIIASEARVSQTALELIISFQTSSIDSDLYGIQVI